MEGSNLNIAFKPIVSVVKGRIIGMEALVVENKNGKENLTIDIDRLYREMAIKKFKELYNKNEDILVFLNINMSIISQFVGSGVISNLIQEYELKPENVVLQIVECTMENVEELKQFIKVYRNKGFLVALSGIGSGFTNLDKIAYVEPDIIKISPSITKDIYIDYYKQEIFKSLINLCKNISTLVIASGIESEDQAIICMELGADMIQGEFIPKGDSLDFKVIEDIETRINELGNKYKNYMTEQIEMEKSKHKHYDDIIENIIKNLSLKDCVIFDDELEYAISRYKDFECIYVLDSNGVQVSDTKTFMKNLIKQKALIFKPAQKGTDHSLKKYYYYLKNMGLEKHVTEPYVSLATGNLCVTISKKFKGCLGKEYILCVDFNPEYIKL